MTLFAVIFTCTCTVLLVRAESTGSSDARLFKMAASTGFVAIALSVGGLSTAYGRMVLLALVFSWIGDLLLTFTARSAFLGGLTTFLLGHVAYSVAFGILGVNAAIAAVTSIGMTIIGLLVWQWLSPHAEDMAAPVITYIVVITVIVVAAFAAFGDGASVFIPIGAGLFHASVLLLPETSSSLLGS